ncbi:MAG: anaerobic sulfatase maturase [Clostridiaceae bacterium]
MPNQTILIKPASGYCNMNCKYCFYYDVMNNRGISNYGFMTQDTLEEIVKKAFMHADNYVGFAFQGGEPTLAGLQFYRNFMNLLNQYNVNRIKVDLSLQTNGITINDEWAVFFNRNSFLIGLSMDGPPETHDINRIDKLGEGTHAAVIKASKILRKHHVDFNILTVVTKNIARHPGKVYNFLKKNGFMYMQFIPCLDELAEAPGTKPFSLTPKDYGDFLCQIFDLWYRDFKQNIPTSVRMIDNLIQILLGYPPESCDMIGKCSVNTVIEADGSVYPCDFYVLDEWKLGSILDEDFSSLKKQHLGIQFVEESLVKNSECLKCAYHNLCKAGCKRHFRKEINFSSNYYCSSYKQFYSYTIERLREVASILKYGIIL